MSLFGSRRPLERPLLPGGYRLYAIGDVHGRDDLLGELLRKIEADHAARGPANLILVFLGDLVDRGASSAQVVERLRTYRPSGARVIFLAGNHEEVMLRILDGDVGVLPDWLRFGGAECLRSYGLEPKRLRHMEPGEALAAIRAAIPPNHADFLHSFDDTFRAGGYLFVHAGIRPGVPLDEQARADLRWIREPFLSDRAEHGFVVVHGHTVREQVEERANRIGIDTGAYRSGVLTALGLEAGDRWLLQATDIEPDVEQSAIPSVLDGVSGQSG